MLLLALIWSSAFAQEPGFDGHGLVQVPTDGDLADSLVTWRPERQTPSIASSVIMEWSEAPLVVVQGQPGALTRTELVDDLLTANIGVHAALHERVALGLSAPIHLTHSGPGGWFSPALGDFRLSAPVTLILPDDEQRGFGLSVVPHLDMPTGANKQLLGAGGLGFGGLAAFGYGFERLHISGNLGAHAVPGLVFLNQRGGPRVLAAVAASYRLTDALAAGVECVSRPALTNTNPVGTTLPTEAIATLRGRLDNGFGFLVGGSKSIVQGAGAADYRLFIGASMAIGKNDRDTDQDGISNRIDACPTQAETFNEYADEDGCPDVLADWTLTVTTPDGQPVANATVLRDGEPVGTTNAQGQLSLADLLPGTQLAGLQVTPADTATLAGQAVPTMVVQEPGEAVTVVLPWLAGSVHVLARTADGEPVDAAIAVSGPSSVESFDLGDDGEASQALGRGAWTLDITAPGYVTVQREAQVEPSQEALVEVVLERETVVVTRGEIVLLDQVHFAFDSDEVLTESYSLLDQVAASLRTHGDYIHRVEVQGHTDDRGRVQYNLDLSQRRVDSVVAYIIAGGIDAERLTATGFGEGCPLQSNSTDEGRATNRRVQFIITDPEPTGGIPCHDGASARVAEPRTYTHETTEPTTP